jgi:uncharacterized phage protein (TIGR01671 family)
MGNREIKFRAWDKNKRVMTKVEGIHFGDDGSALTITFEPAPKSEYHIGLVNGENGILMQSIGELDKNGKDIYEADILITDECSWKAKVVFQRGAFILLDNLGGFSVEPNWNKCEVIGNIFENPELLEVEC